ncbi:MAG: dihydropteroate synthase [Candidatus Kapaibacterium sp.]
MHFREHDDCYYKNVVEEVFAFLEKQINIAKDMGVKDIIADIGIGFGKNKEDNLTLLKNFNYFDKLGLPHLLGISRKRFIGEVISENTPTDRDIATILFHSLLLKEKSIKIIRVHNVEMAMQLKKVYEALN